MMLPIIFLIISEHKYLKLSHPPTCSSKVSFKVPSSTVGSKDVSETTVFS